MVKRASLCLLILFSFCLFSWTLPQVVSADFAKVTLQLELSHRFQFAGYYAALEKGFYSDVGLDVLIMEGGTSIKVLDRLRSGKADYLASGPLFSADTVISGELVAIAAIYQRTPLAFVALESSGVRVPADLQGRRVMHRAEPLLLKMLTNANISSSYQSVSHSGDLQDLIDGHVDAMSISRSDTSQLASHSGARLYFITPHDHGVDAYGNILYTTNHETHRHPQRHSAFRSASLKGWQYALAHPEEIFDLLQDKYGCRLTRDELKYEAAVARQLIAPELAEMGHIDAELWRQLYHTFTLDSALQPQLLDGSIYTPETNILKELAKAREQAFIELVFIFILCLLLVVSIAIYRHRLRKKGLERDALLRQLESSINSMPYLFAFLDKDFNFVRVNAMYAAAVGETPDFFFGKNHFELYPDKENQAIFENVLATRTAYRADAKPFSYPDKPDKIEYFDWVLEPVISSEDVLLGLNLVVKNVTESVKMQHRLQEEIAKAEMFFNSTPIGLVQLNNRGELIDANETFLSFTGYSKDEIGGLSMLEMICKEDRSRIARLMAEARETDTGERARSSMLHKDGTEIPTEGFGRWFRDDQGEIAYGVAVIEDISRRVQQEFLEKKLNVLEGQYKALFNSAQDGFGFANFEGDIQECNQALADMIGLSVTKVKQLKFYEFTPPEYHEMEAELIKHVVETDQPVHYEKEYITPGGRRFPVAVSAFNVKDDNNQSIGLGGIIRDISQERKIQGQVRESEEMLRLLLDSTSEGVYGVDEKGCVTFCNSSCCKILGFSSEEELHGVNMHDLVHHSYPDGNSMAQDNCRIYSAMHKNETIYVDDEVFWKKDGTALPVEYWSSPICKDGDIVGAVVFFADIALRKENERVVQEALTLSRNIISATPVGLSIYDENGDCIEANDSIGPIIGASREQVLAQNIYKIGSWQKFGLLDAAKEALAKQEKVRREFKIETTFGRTGYFDCSFIPFQVDAAMRLLFMIDDITQRRQGEEDLKKTLGQKQMLLREVHHRVKNNLQIVAGLMELQIVSNTPEGTYRNLSDMVNRIHTMALLHESLYRSENIADVLLGDYVEEIVNHLVQSQIGTGGEIHVRTEIAEISMDIDQLLPIGLVVTELVTNALKHAFTDNQGEVVVSFSIESDQGVLKVIDDGAGFDVDGDFPARETLGHRLVSALVRQLNGEMSMRSEGGCVIEITLPLKTEAEKSDG